MMSLIQICVFDALKIKVFSEFLKKIKVFNFFNKYFFSLESLKSIGLISLLVPVILANSNFSPCKKKI